MAILYRIPKQRGHHAEDRPHASGRGPESLHHRTRPDLGQAEGQEPGGAHPQGTGTGSEQGCLTCGRTAGSHSQPRFGEVIRSGLRVMAMLDSKRRTEPSTQYLISGATARMPRFEGAPTRDTASTPSGCHRYTRARDAGSGLS